MKLTVHAAIFSIVFAGFVAGAVNTSAPKSLSGAHSTVISTRMPVPNCPPDTGCPKKAW